MLPLFPLRAIPLAALLVLSPLDAAEPPAHATVESVGNRRAIMQGDLAGKVVLATLRDRPGLYALGPVAGLQGEITIADGVPHVSVLDDQGQPVELPEDEAWRRSAIFLAYAETTAPGTPTTLEPVPKLSALRPIVEATAGRQGIDLDATAFPVVIEGVASRLRYHVIWKQDDAPHSHQAHQRAKITFDRREVPVRLIGVFSRPGEGAYTHPGNPLHLHVVLPAQDGDGTVSGHVDGLELAAGAVLRIPGR